MTSGERTRYYQVRPRRVPPEFATDELLEDCSLLATLLLYRLISLADDQGRVPGHAKRIRAGAFPLREDVTERKVGRALDELVRAGFVIRYDVAGRTYLQIHRWFDMQGKWGQRRTYPSRYPAPPGWDGDWITAGSDEDEVRAPGAQDARNVPPPLPSASSSPSTSTLTGQFIRRSRGGDPERVGQLFERAKRGLLTKDEAIEFGSAMALDEQSRRRTAR